MLPKLLLLSSFILIHTTLFSQISNFPYSESFDGIVAPSLPAGWSVIGFKDTTTSPHSSPNCIYGTGNTTQKSLTSPVFDFANRFPSALTYWERRSTTALSYRLELRATLDGINYNILLTRFDTSSSSTSYIQRIIDLSQSGLQQQSHVQFKWILLKDSTNTSGVLRIDDVGLTVATGFDVSIGRLTAQPIMPTRADSITCSIVLKNIGLSVASNVGIQWFEDMRTSGVPDAGALFYSTSGVNLNQNDSLICTASHQAMKAGIHRIVAIVQDPVDENHANDTAQCMITVGYNKSDILINEIMYAPVGDEPEWVEVLNASSDTIDLKNWKISDSNVSTKNVISTSSVLIPPQALVVIAKDASFYSVHPLIPAIITSFAALNNSPQDAVVIYDPQNRAIDSVMYQSCWGGQNGVSLERIDYAAPSASAVNWKSCEDSLGSTPVRINSIARLDYDLCINSVREISEYVAGKIVPRLFVTICNAGRTVVDTLTIHFYADSNKNAEVESSELLCSRQQVSPLSPGDSVILSEDITELNAGAIDILVILECCRDQRLRNNMERISVKNSYDPQTLIINEIMYEPLNGQCEWIELYNRSASPADLSQWSFHDRLTASGVNSFSLGTKSIIVQPQHYVVIASDSTIQSLWPYLMQDTAHCLVLNRSNGFGLNNDGDAVVLCDLTGAVIDSVCYSSSWHSSNVIDTRGRSLERINSAIRSNDQHNWSTSTNAIGGTPARTNSIAVASRASSAVLSVSPNPFSPDGDGFEDFCLIHYSLPTMSSTLQVRVYDIKGRKVRTLAGGILAGAQGDIVWDGMSDDKQRARIGVYVVYLEAYDRSTGRTVSAKTVAVVAAKL